MSGDAGERLVVLCTAPDLEVARRLARGVVDARLAACVNILPAVESVYRWQGVVEEATEVELIMKTTRACFAALQAFVVEAHPYDVPALVALPVATGLPDYLAWIAEETGMEPGDDERSAS